MSPILSVIGHLLLEVAECLGLRIFPCFEVIVCRGCRCILLFLFSLLFGNCAIPFQKAPFSVREIFLPINLSVVYGTRDKLVQVSFNIREVLRISLVLFTVVWFQEVCALHLWWIVRLNAERLDPQRLINDLVDCQIIL